MPKNVSEESCAKLIESKFGKSLGQVVRNSRNKKHRSKDYELLKDDPLVDKLARVVAT